jgi:hypothetical protein
MPKLLDPGGDIILPDALLLGDNNQDTKAESWSLVFADGAFSAGDEIKPRKVVLEGTLGAVDRATFRAMADALRYTCSRPGLKLQLVTGGGYLHLSRLLGVDEDPERLFDWSVAKVRITWQCDDPFWYSPTLETRTFSPSGDTTLTVDAGPGAGLPECYRGVYPTITCTSPGYLPVPTFTLRNTTDEDLQLRYSDPYLKNGNYATIDCVNGLATRSDGANTIRYLEGEFLRLLTKSNALEYEGGACDLAISWRPRWL